MSRQAIDAADDRFAFGANWLRFAGRLDARAIAAAERSWLGMLKEPFGAGASMLDIGCGSGLSSLVAHRRGLAVRAFDYDADAVACSVAVREKFGGADADWRIERGDVLDASFMDSLGRFDLVYAWGSLHHTGNLWQAMDSAAARVAEHGRFFVAIYNDQGGASRRWRAVKRLYQSLPRPLRPWLVAICLPASWWKDTVKDIVRGRPFATWRNYVHDRGMSPWRDMVDWVGGYPFEVAKPEEVIDFAWRAAFTLERLKTVGGGFGCNEFVFERP